MVCIAPTKMYKFITILILTYCTFSVQFQTDSPKTEEIDAYVNYVDTHLASFSKTKENTNEILPKRCAYKGCHSNNTG